MSGPVMLVARREIMARLRQRAFQVGLAITLLVVVAIAVAPKLFEGGTKTYDVAVVGTGSAAVSQQVRAAAAAQGVSVRVHTGVDADTARAKVRNGSWEAALVNDDQIVTSSADSTATALLQGAHQAVAIDAALRAAGLSDEQIARAYDVPPVAVQSVTSNATTQRSALATVIVVLLFTQLITYCTWVAMGVVEEKSSRVVEVLLSAIRPLQLLTGKLLGIGVLAIGQTLLIGIVGVSVAGAAGTLSIPGGAWDVVVIALVAYVLGFAFFAAMAAALSSTVSRQEEVSGVLAPMTIVLMACYLASFSVVGAPHSSSARWLSVLPPVSSIAMPARIAGGQVPLIQVVLAVAGLLVAAALMLLLAARIYRASILHMGSRISLRQAWRSEAVGDPA